MSPIGDTSYNSSHWDLGSSFFFAGTVITTIGNLFHLNISVYYAVHTTHGWLPFNKILIHATLMSLSSNQLKDIFFCHKLMVTLPVSSPDRMTTNEMWAFFGHFYIYMLCLKFVQLWAVNKCLMFSKRLVVFVKLITVKNNDVFCNIIKHIKCMCIL